MTDRSAAQNCVPLVKAFGIEHLETLLSKKALVATWLVLAIAAGARLVIALLYADTDPASANVWEYGGIAIDSLRSGAIVSHVHRADGSTFVYPTAFMPPLLVFLDMGVFWLAGVTSIALKILIGLNVIFGTLVVLYTQRIAELLFGSRTVALLAALIAALHPVFVYSAATYHAVNLYLFLFLLLVYLASCQSARLLIFGVLAGAVWGLAVLARTEYAVLGAVVVFASFLRHRSFRTTVATGLMAALIVLPWTFRNYEVFGQFIPVADPKGYALYKGFNPEANGSGHWVDFNHVAERRLGPQLAAVPLDSNYELNTDHVYLEAAKSFIASAPISTLAALSVKKVLLFWLFDIYDPTTHKILYQVALWPTIIFSILGAVLVSRGGFARGRPLGMVVALFGVETMVMVAYAVHARYRMNVEPFLFMFAAVGVLWLVTRLRRSGAWRQLP